VRILIVHNRYRSEMPSGENFAAEEEEALLIEHGCNVERFVVDSDEIASWSLAKRLALPARVVWSTDGYRRTRFAIERSRPEVIHFHNTFPLLSPSALWAAHKSGVAVVQTLHNFRPLCANASFFRKGQVCESCLGRVPFPAIRYGCYRGSVAATIPVAAMEAFHRLLRTWTRCVDMFITPSNFVRRKYIEAGWPAAQVVVKPNCAKDPGARRSGAGDGFLCLSRLGREKGIDVLVDAWGQAFSETSQRLTIVGHGDEEATLGAAAAHRV
jgi:glycosyltransferase involved in cell wall biosynthesis